MATLSCFMLVRAEKAESDMLAGIKFGGTELVGLIVAVSFAAGLNVYATVATLGLLAHVGLLDLPSGLHMLSSWWVIAASGALFAWNSLPTRFLPLI